MLKKGCILGTVVYLCLIINSHAASSGPWRKMANCEGPLLSRQISFEDPKLIWRTDKNILWRGDTSNAGVDAFRTGLLPKGVLRNYPEAEREFDWRCHQFESFRSVFVSTSTNEKTAIDFTKNEKYNPSKKGWVYEIHAPGGIDQDLSSNTPTNETEISFPGGIKGKYIKRACFYDNGEQQFCENNQDAEDNPWTDNEDDVSAVKTELSKVVPKADANACQNDIKATMPKELCPIPDMATTVYLQDGDKLEKEGMAVHYDVSSRGSDKPARWIIIKTGFNKLVDKVEITSDMPDVGNIRIPADKFVEHRYRKSEQRWSLGISHTESDNEFMGPVSFTHTTYLDIPKGVTLMDYTREVQIFGDVDGNLDNDGFRKGFRVTPSAPDDKEVWLFSQQKDPVTGEWGTPYPYEKIKAGSNSGRIVYIPHPESTKTFYRFGLSENLGQSDIKTIGTVAEVLVLPRENKVKARIIGSDTISGQDGLMLSAAPDGIDKRTLFAWSVRGKNATKINLSSTDGIAPLMRIKPGTVSSPFEVEVLLTVTDPDSHDSSTDIKSIKVWPEKIKNNRIVAAWNHPLPKDEFLRRVGVPSSAGSVVIDMQDDKYQALYRVPGEHEVPLRAGSFVINVTLVVLKDYIPPVFSN